MDEKLLKDTLAKNLKILRAKNDYSQEQLAELADISQQQISFLENGKMNPKLTMLVQIAEVFGITVNDLIYESKY